MGIQNLNPEIKKILEEKKAPSAHFTLPITELSGYRIAIDAFNLMWAQMAGARKRVIERTDVGVTELDNEAITLEFLSMCLHFIERMMFYGITPVFVFDGEHPPEKGDTKEKRRQKNLANKTRLEELKAIMSQTEIPDQTMTMIMELRRVMAADIHISRSDCELYRQLLESIGIPCIQAQGDGEQVCSMLCLEEKVAAVYSADTDNLAYGCPLVIRMGKERSYSPDGNSVETFDCVRIDHILAGLEMPYPRFLDLCIMSGCDYNTNVKGNGVKKSYNLLQTHGSLENLPKTIDTTCLDYQRCREIFSRVPSSQIIVHPEGGEKSTSLKLSFRSFIEKGRSFLAANGLSDPHSVKLFERYRKMIPARDGRPLYISHPDSPLVKPRLEYITAAREEEKEECGVHAVYKEKGEKEYAQEFIA